ncbi:ZN683 protein, partial [Acromyrmex heyeri]
MMPERLAENNANKNIPSSNAVVNNIAGFYDKNVMQNGYNPNLQNGYNPNLQNEYNSNLQNGYNPNLQNGYNPNLQNGYNPNLQNEYNSNLQNGYNPNLQTGCTQQINDTNSTNLWCHSFAGGSNSLDSRKNFHPSFPPTSQFSEHQQVSQYSNSNYQVGPPFQVARQQPSNHDGNFQGYQNSLYNSGCQSLNNTTNVYGTNVPNSSGYHNLPSSSESLKNISPEHTVLAPSLTQTNNAQPQLPGYACSEKHKVCVAKPFTTTFTTSPTSTNNTRSITATNAASTASNVPYEQLPLTYSSLNFSRNKTEFNGVNPEERQQSCGASSSSSRFIPVTRYNVTTNTLHRNPFSVLLNANVGTSGNNACVDRNRFLKEHPLKTAVIEEQHKLPQPQQESPVIPRYRANNANFFLETRPTVKEQSSAINTNVAGTIADRNRSNFKQQSFCAGRSTSDPSLVKHAALPHYLDTISPTSNIVSEMKYETQSGPPAAPPHLTSSGVEPPHSSQGSGIVVGNSPAEIDSLLLPWTNGPEFLEGGVPDAKQTAVGFQDNWDSILGTTVSEQSLPDVKLLPLPPFTNYTGHLQINGIPGHHYHTIASSGQRSSIDVPSASPTPSSNQEFFESPVVSSSTPCPQASQKPSQQQQQQQQPQQNHQQPQHHHPHNQQQQLPQSTQQIIYEDMDDIAQIIGSAIADTTVPGNGNGPSSEQDTDASRDWIDIADWITDCSPKTQETTSPNTFAHQIYVTTTPTTQTQQHAGSALQNLLTQNPTKLDYAPLLQARLQQSGNPTNLQNASCGETPSSTSPFPPLSPPNRVSTSCSPEDILHSSFATPSHPRKRSRSSPGSGGSPSKKGPTAGAVGVQYGTESSLMSGKDKPIHRCHICQRGFLNKSNIKVHLRTHTGEKPFRCDVCNKAFRQKAHLIKHQQIHKRIGRD